MGFLAPWAADCRQWNFSGPGKFQKPFSVILLEFLGLILDACWCLFGVFGVNLDALGFVLANCELGLASHDCNMLA